MCLVMSGKTCPMMALPMHPVHSSNKFLIWLLDPFPTWSPNSYLMTPSLRMFLVLQHLHLKVNLLHASLQSSCDLTENETLVQTILQDKTITNSWTSTSS